MVMCVYSYLHVDIIIRFGTFLSYLLLSPSFPHFVSFPITTRLISAWVSISHVSDHLSVFYPEKSGWVFNLLLMLSDLLDYKSISNYNGLVVYNMMESHTYPCHLYSDPIFKQWSSQTCWMRNQYSVVGMIRLGGSEFNIEW